MARSPKYTSHQNKARRCAVKQRHSCDARWRKSKFRQERGDRFCLPSTHGSGACHITAPRYRSAYLCALFCGDHAYHYERILNQRPFVVVKQHSSETSESFFGNVFAL